MVEKAGAMSRHYCRGAALSRRSNNHGDDDCNGNTTTSLTHTILRKFRLKRHKKKWESMEIPRHCNAGRYDSAAPLASRDPQGTPLPPPPEQELLNSPWYQSGLPRDVALEILSQQEIGSFIVRDSASHRGCYALSVKVPKYDNPAGISHYLIQRTHNGMYRLKGVEKEWCSLSSLVAHHTVMPELLPVVLRLPRTANNPTFRPRDPGDDLGGEPGDDDLDPEYSRLAADFSHMMTQLKM